MAFTPDGGGTAPTTLYDVTLTDAALVDVLAGVGANLSATLTTVHVPVVGTYFRRTLEAGNLIPVVANAGNAKGGIIAFLLQPR